MKITRHGPTVYLEGVGEVKDTQTIEVSAELGRELVRRGEWTETKVAGPRTQPAGGD